MQGGVRVLKRCDLKPLVADFAIMQLSILLLQPALLLVVLQAGSLQTQLLLAT